MKLPLLPRTSKKRRRRVFLGLIVLGSLPVGLWSCFPAPIPELWPPRPGEPRHRIDVVYHDWHTIIVVPEEADPPAKPSNHLEWELCEKAWYLEGHQGLGGVFRALFWPTASAVGRRESALGPWERFPADEVERWTFILSEEGLRAMEAYLESQRGAALAEFPGWYEGRRSYHLFFHCHHFAACALRAAGLPIRPWWAFSAWMVEIQLDRIRRFHEQEGM